ncbi:MAG: M20 family metallopeptidase [Rhodobiaceae bacterium]|nr:M20 family metallopeptidase [Rhodobiaceae bacterium]
MTTMLSELIALDTSFPPGTGYPAMADLLERLCAPLGGDSERIEVPEHLWAAPGVEGARVNLIVRPDMGSAAPPNLPEAMIYFHVDTAPVGDGWTRPPLRLTVEDDRLYGRGTADMKGTIVAVLDALTRLKASGAPLAFRPVLAFCTDEEGGLYPGIRHLAETRPLPDVLLNLNGSAEPRIWAGCLGSMDFSLAIEGRAAHSGTPQLGVNAIEAAIPALAALDRLKADIEIRTTTMSPPPNADGPLRARLTVTAIHAGDKGSAVPGHCRITVNRRYLPEEEPGAVEAEIRAALDAALATTAALGWTLEQVGHLPPVVDPDGPATDRWTAARAAAFGLPLSAFTRYGSGTSSDFGWVQRAGQKHMLLGGLSRPGRNVHAADEHTTAGDLVDLSRAVELFLSAEFDPADPAFENSTPAHIQKGPRP